MTNNTDCLTNMISKKEDEQLLKEQSILINVKEDGKPFYLITKDMDDYLALYSCTVFAQKTDRLAKDNKPTISLTINKVAEDTYYIDFSLTTSNLIHHIRQLNDLNLQSVQNANPYLRLFHKHFNCIYAQGIKSKGYFNERQFLIITEMIKACHRFFDEKESSQFQQEVTEFVQQFNKDKEQLNTYIDELYQRNSRMMVLRLDLFYTKEYRNKMSLQQVHTDNNNFIKFLKTRYGSDLKGYVWKMEYAKTKGFCIRYVVLLSGSKFFKDITMCKILGDTWKHEVTQFRGSYYNRNVYKRDHEESILGLKSHDDDKARKGFYKLLDAFVRTNNYTKALFTTSADYIGTGELKPISKRGRPRKTISFLTTSQEEPTIMKEDCPY